VERFPHLMVNRTFSKAYGLAGFRIGYLLCDPKLASYFNRVRIPWNVSLISIAAALASLEDMQDQQVKRQNIIDGRKYIYEQVCQIPGLQAYPSEGNFVLIDGSSLGISSTEIRDRMQSKGIFIRPMSGHNMPKGFIRVTVGTAEQNRFFIRCLKKLVAELKSN
jgi:histidinol-phosphate aminotransferase